MQVETFKVMNVKCNGCVNTIRQNLRQVPGVCAVEVEIASGQVTVTGAGLARADLAARLAALGYPAQA